MSLAKPYSGIAFLSNARGLIVLEQIRPRAEEKGDARLVDETNTALGHHYAWRETLNAWIAQNRSRARQGGETAAVDADADFICSSIHDIVARLKRGRSNTEAGREAAKVLLDHFTDARGRTGAGIMTAVVYEEQLPRMRALHVDLSADPARARLLRVSDWVDDLGEVIERYAAALSANRIITWGEVIARRNTAYDSLFAVVGLIFANHRRDPGTLGYLLAPLDDQLARAAEYARRRRAGQASPISEDELTPEDLLAMEEVDDVDGDGVPDAEAGAEQPPAPQPDAPQPDAPPEAGAQPEAAQPEAPRPEAPQPEAPQPEAQPPVRRPLPE